MYIQYTNVQTYIWKVGIGDKRTYGRLGLEGGGGCTGGPGYAGGRLTYGE